MTRDYSVAEKRYRTEYGYDLSGSIGKLPKRGHYIIEALRVCAWIIFLGFFTALAVELIYGAVRLLGLGAMRIGQ